MKEIEALQCGAVGVEFLHGLEVCVCVCVCVTSMCACACLFVCLFVVGPRCVPHSVCAEPLCTKLANKNYYYTSYVTHN